MSLTGPEARIRVELCEERLAEALEQALRVEAENPPDPERGEIRVKRSGSSIEVHVKSRDYSSARALLNAVLTLIATVTDSVREVKHELQEDDKD